MPRISFHIDEKTLKKVEDAATRQHTSISKRVAEQIRSRVEPTYPITFESLFGSIVDDTFKEPDEIGISSDAQREGL